MSNNHRTLTEPKSKMHFSVEMEEDGETITIARIYKPIPDSQFYEIVQYSIKPSELSMKLLDIIYRHYCTLGDVPTDRNIKTTVKMTPKLASVYRELVKSYYSAELPNYETITQDIIEIDKAYRKQQQEGGY